MATTIETTPAPAPATLRPTKPDPSGPEVPKTMKAVQLHEYGGPEVLRVETLPIPTPSTGEVLMRVRATSVTWWDLAFRRGYLQKITVPGRRGWTLPFQPGREAAGDIAAVGPGLNTNTTGPQLQVGDKVVIMTCPACGHCPFCTQGYDNLCIKADLPGHTAPGGYAEYLLVRAENVLKVPEPSISTPQKTGASWEKLACCLWSYGTVLHMVDQRARIRPGDCVLITGASSGMGTAGIQLAKLAGANPIIGLTGSPGKKQSLLDAGADVVLNYKDEDVQVQIRKATPGGFGPDVVLDMVGGHMATLAIQVAKLGARIVMAAVMGGRSIELDIVTVFAKHLDLLGSRASTREEQARCLKLLVDGKIDPLISDVLPLEDVVKAHELLEQGTHVGKVVLKP
ncbi:hypothetical protein ABEF95_011040 [Exophiala dermatitidis]